MAQEHWRRLSSVVRSRIRRQVYDRDGGRCWRCHRVTTLDGGDVDHLVEQRHDPTGNDTRDVSLMAWACRRCNRGRHNKRQPPARRPNPSRDW